MENYGNFVSGNFRLMPFFSISNNGDSGDNPVQLIGEKQK